MTEETDVHRSVQEALASLVVDGEEGQEPAVFPAESLQKIEGIVDAFIGSTELIDCVETILVVAHLLEVEKESPRAAKKLVAIVDRDKVIDAMKALNNAKDDDRREGVAKTAEQFSKFSASDQQKKAPSDAEDAPKGSLKIGALDFPKRM